MNIKDFYELVELKREPDAVILLDLQFLTKKYPFFQAGLYTYIKCLYLSDSSNFQKELNRLAPFIMDRKALFYYVMDAEYKEFPKKAGRAVSESRTEALISAFFETIDDNTEIQHRLEHAIVNSSMASLDYFSYLESAENREPEVQAEVDGIPSFSTEDINIYYGDSQEIITIENELETEDKPESKPEPIQDTAQMKHQDIIDSFISKAQDKENLRITLDTSVQDDSYNEDEVQEDKAEELDDDFFFTQTLANIYIKQKKYNRAYEIIKRLSLNYPEKNIYFADQLSFLEKVIKNSNKNK